jgi:hypothetical protein
MSPMDYSLERAFPLAERITFERDVLYPLAGLDPALAGVRAAANPAPAAVRAVLKSSHPVFRTPFP